MNDMRHDVNEKVRPDPRKPIKKTALLGMVLFLIGFASVGFTWALYKEVWIISAVPTIVGLFLFVHALIAKSTNMG
jgi:hypothetical protein